MVRLDEKGPPLSDVDIARLEKRLKARLPETYRDFLFQTNGGVPTPETVDIPGAPGSPTDVQVFFGIGRESETSDLGWNAEAFIGRVPPDVLPIACDSGGNLFCLAIRGSEAGKVSYLDLERAGASYEVAADFDVFLKMIRPFS